LPKNANLKEYFDILEEFKPCKEFPLFVAKNLQGRWAKAFGSNNTHYQFICDFAEPVKAIKFNSPLPQLPERFTINKTVYRLTKNYTGGCDILIEDIQF
jgi:hypothetical protein